MRGPAFCVLLRIRNCFYPYPFERKQDILLIQRNPDPLLKNVA